MKKERARAIMDHMIATVAMELSDWKSSEKSQTSIGLKCSWTKELDQLSILLLLLEGEEGIIVCATGPRGVNRRHFRNISSRSGEAAIKTVVQFSKQLRFNEDE